MKSEIKALIGISVITILIIAVAAFLLGKSPQQSILGQADSALLIRNNSNKIFSSSAELTLVEFGDYQCPACGAAHPVVKQILEKDKDKVTFVFRSFPLTQHKNARIAAQTAEAAGEQGKYWEMHDKLYENQSDWGNNDNALEIFTNYAKDMGLDIEKFKKTIAENKYADKIAQDQSDGMALGVNSTPTFFINNQKYMGTLNELESAIEKTLK